MKLSDRNKFKRKLFGAEEKTHGGIYSAKTRGYLSNKKYEKPVRSVIIINERYEKGVLKILRDFGAEVKTYTIVE